MNRRTSRRLNTGNKTMPARNPPRWASQPMTLWLESARAKPVNCSSSQTPIKPAAAKCIMREKGPSGNRMLIRAKGYSSRQAARMPATAPLAPIIGTAKVGLESACASIAAIPQSR